MILLIPPTLSSEDAVREMTIASAKASVESLVPIDPTALSAKYYQPDELHLGRKALRYSRRHCRVPFLRACFVTLIRLAIRQRFVIWDMELQTSPPAAVTLLRRRFWRGTGQSTHAPLGGCTTIAWFPPIMRRAVRRRHHPRASAPRSYLANSQCLLLPRPDGQIIGSAQLLLQGWSSSGKRARGR